MVLAALHVPIASVDAERVGIVLAFTDKALAFGLSRNLDDVMEVHGVFVPFPSAIVNSAVLRDTVVGRGVDVAANTLGRNTPASVLEHVASGDFDHAVRRAGLGVAVVAPEHLDELLAGAEADGVAGKGGIATLTGHFDNPINLKVVGSADESSEGGVEVVVHGGFISLRRVNVK